MRKMPGAHYPDDLPAPGRPVPDPQPGDERTMALRYVRTAFDPPLPDPFADWLITLHAWVREGRRAEATVMIPPEITDLGFTFLDAVAGGRGMSLVNALRLFGREDLVEPGPGEHGHRGVVALVAALTAYGIHTTTTVHRTDGGCTVRLSDEQAQHLADRLIPVEGTTADELGKALELLDQFVHRPKPTPCDLDHHGYCQEHHDDFADASRFAQHEGYDLLVRHGVRETK